MSDPMATKQKTKRVFWHNDNDGPGTRSSLDLLLDWISTEGNYAKWKGGMVKKETVAKEILIFLKEKGAKKNRITRDIFAKMYEIETKFKATKDFLNSTGAGILTEVSLRKEVEKSCPYFYMLEAVMGHGRSGFFCSSSQRDEFVLRM